MGNLGGGEILVILLVGLLVLGPQRLPTVGRQVGRLLAQIKHMSSGFQEEFRAAMEDPVPDFEGKQLANDLPLGVKEETELEGTRTIESQQDLGDQKLGPDLA